MGNKGTITGKEVLDGVYEEIARSDAKMREFLTTYKEFISETQKVKSASGGNAIIKQRAELDGKVNIELNERNGLLKKLAIQEERNRQVGSQVSKDLAKQRLNTQLLNKANKENATLTSKYATAYQKLSVQLIQARRNLKDLVITQGENAKATKRAAREVQNLDKRLKRADAISGQFQRNVGNYKSTLGGAVGSIRALVGAFGIYSGLQIAKSVFGQVKAIDGLNKSLLQVTETQEKFNEAQSFLRDLSDEAGSDILSLTKAYVKFAASAKTTTLNQSQIENIFRQTAKAAGVLGLSTDDATGAFRALEQILSKGKVQAEEIRGQLGERLPGAFQILAKSMGLTTAELSKQLELGNVLSDEVLPGFADELERTYSLGLVKRVETLAAEQNRLGNAWTLFIQNVENGDGTLTRVIGGLLASITAVVDAMAKLSQSEKSMYQEIRADQAKQELEDLEYVAKKTGLTIKEVASNSFFDYTKSVEKAREELKKLEAEQKVSPTARNKKAIDDAKLELSIRLGRLDAINNVLKKGTNEVNKTDYALKKVTKSVKDLTPNIKKIKGAFSDLTESEELDKLARRFRDVFDGTEFNQSQGLFEGEIDGVKTFFEVFDKEKVKFGLDALDIVDIESINKALLETLPNTATTSAKKLNEIYSGVFDSFESYYGIDLTAFRNLLSDKEVSLDDYASFAKSISGAIFDSQQIRYQNEIEANRERLDLILNDESASEEKKRQAQIESDKENKKIRLKQAKAERKNLLIQIAIETAMAVTKALLNAAALASNPFTAAFAANAYKQAAIAGGLGLAQAAFVAAQPLPKFFKGTKNAPQGLAYTDERGAEIHTDRHGNVKDWGSNKGARLKFLERGDKIFNAGETNKILQNISLPTRDNVMNKLTQDSMKRTNWVQSPVNIEPLRGIISEEIKQGFKNIKITNINNNNFTPKTTGFRV